MGIIDRPAAPKGVPRLLGLILAVFVVGCGDTQKREVAQRAEPAPTVDNSPPPSRLLNQFDVSDALIPVEKIERGGPDRDGIPSIDEPKFLAVKDVGFLGSNDLVLSVTLGDETRAYPLLILDHHEIVNDRIGTNDICVTYCPLCGSGMVFDRRIGGDVLGFGVSGLLYQSDVLMYDRQTESLWSQLKMQAVTGEKKGSQLRQLVAEQMTAGAWIGRYPQGQVLSTNTGYLRRYTGKAYASYERQSGPMFDVGEIRDELPAKAWVIGLLVDGKSFAVPTDRLPTDKPKQLKLAGREFLVVYDRMHREPGVLTLPDREHYPYTLAYWFAWQAFHRNTEIVPKS
ncbi:MAG: DUF3179 domain-containing protein [Limisphaerales bacterium]